MGEPQLDPLLVQRNIILVVLLMLAAAAWAVLVWAPMSMDMPTTASATGLYATLFLATWVVMMLAMMFPATAPMFLAFHKDQCAKFQPDDAFAFTWIFITAYLFVWAMAGIATYIGELGASAVRYPLGPATTAQLGGVVMLLAGIYQLTPLKELYLRECCMPIDTTSWHREKTDVFRMG